MSDKEILIGRHLPLTKPSYILGSIKQAVEKYKCNSFMVYLFSPRTFSGADLEKFNIRVFRRYISESSFNIDNIIVHSSYLVNLGNFEDKKKLAWSIEFLKKEFRKVDTLGLKTIVIHPGNSLNLDKERSLKSISSSLDEILRSVPNIRVCLETMAGSGSQLGKNFDEIRTIIKNSKLSDRIGVCWDTCHLYASGYDIKNKLDEVINDFDNKIGLQKLWVIHVNDSVFEIGSKKDRHANIGFGKIGLKSISLICHHKSFENSIKILETPAEEDLNEKEIYQIKNFFIQN